jgi:UDP-N-acetylglucosamine--N-acetylmuramyl-(pentapeptide) pyrophosphoryl-undecaprenol N-acetylglucosamine transferase
VRILFAGGGTAGHINPAIAIANHIREEHPEAEIAFVGTPKGMENRLVPKEDYPLYHIDIQGFQRKLTPKNVATLYKAVRSLHESGKIIRGFKPDVVVGTGGYVSGPVLYKAAQMGIPTAIHEQNAFPGMTSKILSRVVDRVLISFDSSRKFFTKVPQEKMILTGNPIRDNMSRLTREEAKEAIGVNPDMPLLVCFAGSLGAEAINRVMEEMLQTHKDDHRMTVIWATGERYFDEISGRLQPVLSQPQYQHIHVQRYIYNMDQVMAAADLLVCRSGAITLSELACLGKAAVLIPSPNVTGNHQYYNAKAFADIGGAVLVEEKDLTAEGVYAHLDRLLVHPEELHRMEEQVRTVAYPKATAHICSLILDLAEKGSPKGK